MKTQCHCATPVEAQNAPIHLAPGGLALFIGMDVHNDSIAISIAAGDSTEVRRYGIIGGPYAGGRRCAVTSGYLLSALRAGLRDELKL